jgi:hypothetical protein
MFRRTAFFAAVAAWAFVAVQARAQPTDPGPPAAAASPMAGQRAYDDRQMRAFAGATLDLQALGSQDPAAMTHVIEARGMSVQQYNQMGDAMRGDKALEGRLAPYLQSAQAERAGGGYTPPAAGRQIVWDNPYIRPHSATGGSRQGYHRTTSSRHRHGKASHKAASHKAAAHKGATHKSSSKHRAAPHATTRHRRHRG